MFEGIDVPYIRALVQSIQVHHPLEEQEARLISSFFKRKLLKRKDTSILQ